MISQPSMSGMLSTRDDARVVYLCQWTGTSGGIQVLYEHVRLLRRLGTNALLGAHGPFRRCEWFDNDPALTPAIDDCLAGLQGNDVLVVPEICIGAPELSGLRGRRVAFVQNPSLLRTDLTGFECAMVPAHTLVPWLRAATAFDGPIAVVPGFLDSELVRSPRRFTDGRVRVLLIDRPDKHRGEPSAARERLRQRTDIEVTYVASPMPRQQFVELFRAHDVYLHLSHPEGFPISVLEAFGAGCLVVGFAGIGGLEFMQHDRNCFVAPDGDVAGAIATLTEALHRPSAELDQLLACARATAAAFPETGTANALARLCARGPESAP